MSALHVRKRMLARMWPSTRATGRSLALGMVLGMVALVVGQTAAVAAPAEQAGPAAPIRFVLAVDGREQANFTEIVEIASEIEVSEYQANGSSGVTLGKSFGKQKPPAVVLRRPFTASTEIWSWQDLALKGNPAARKSATLTMLNANGKNIATYQLENAWPSKIEIGAQRVDGSGPLSETVTLACDGLRRTNPTNP